MIMETTSSEEMNTIMNDTPIENQQSLTKVLHLQGFTIRTTSPLVIKKSNNGFNLFFIACNEGVGVCCTRAVNKI